MTAGESTDRGLLIDGVTQRYGKVEALSAVTLSVIDGEFLTLLGPSGCGKTTLLRILGGFLHPTEGRVVHNGVELTRVPPHQRPFNVVFQRPTLFPHLDVFENIAFGCESPGCRRPRSPSGWRRRWNSYSSPASSVGARTSCPEVKCSASP